jgi:hypothetical protein
VKDFKMTAPDTPKATHGGARPGSGRKPAPPLSTEPADATPLAFLLALMRDPGAPTDKRLAAAVAALPYVHAKAAPVTGKRDAAQAAAATAARPGAKFAPRRPPALAMVSRGEG